MSMSQQRWVLAFDASCHVCETMAREVDAACDGKLQLVPLASAEVERWRTEIYGAQPPWTPTLFRVNGESVKAWTGRAMGLQLSRVLGVRATWRVLAAIGRAGEATRAQEATAARSGVSRKQFLGQVAAASAAAGGLMVFGKLPAASAAPSEADTWVQNNLGNLPRDYDSFAGFDMAHRTAIYAKLPADARSALWTEQLRRYQKSHPQMTGEQQAALSGALALFGQPALFAAPLTDGSNSQVNKVKEAAIAAFGEQEAGTLLATLGPVAAALAGCTCSTISVYCGGRPCVNNGNCARSSYGCGTGWLYACDGRCY